MRSERNSNIPLLVQVMDVPLWWTLVFIVFGGSVGIVQGTLVTMYQIKLSMVKS